MSVMYCFIDPFVINQNIFLAEEPDRSDMSYYTKVDLAKLPEFFATSYKDNSCNKIILYSGSQSYTEKIADDIRTYALTNYSLKNIDIEIIRSLK